MTVRRILSLLVLVTALVLVAAATADAVPLGCHFGREQDGGWAAWFWAFNSFFTGGWGCIPAK